MLRLYASSGRIEYLFVRVEASVTRRPPTVPYERNSRIRFLDSSSFDQTGNQTGTPIWRITLLSDKLSDIMDYSWFWQRILCRKIFNFYFTLMRSPRQPVFPSSKRVVVCPCNGFKIADHTKILVVAP